MAWWFYVRERLHGGAAWWQARPVKLGGGDGAVLLHFGAARVRERDRRARVRVREGTCEACPPYGLATRPSAGILPPYGSPSLRTVGHRGHLESAIRPDSVD